jgi:peroxiredoxin
MPLLDAFRRKYKDQGLEVFAITTEDSVPKKQLREVESLLSFPLATYLNGKGYGILTGVPTNYVIDRNGIVRHAQAGAFDLESLNGLLIPLLREPAP